MWPWTDWKLRRALRRYRRERDLEAVLQMDWHRDLDLSAFFTDVEERLHGEEITRLRQKQAEYLALQNQINPHFLYNALEAIRTDALLANCPDIAETTEALATFFRYTISNVQEYVTFSDELDNAENYFTIQRCRFGDKISLELELENERLLEVRMPKLILQPLVENAVSHGLEGKLGHGTVRIIVENSDRTFFLRVRDDGVGMPDEQVERLNAQFGGVGGADMTQPCGGIAPAECQQPHPAHVPREDRRVSGKAQGAGDTENRGRKSGDRPDGARTAYDPGSAERHAVRRHSSRQFG